MQRTLHIATAIDQAYLVPLQVTVASLQKHLRTSLQPRLYLLHRALRHTDIAAVAGLIDTRAIVPGENAIRNLPRQSHFSPEASFPLLLPDVLPGDVDRVLFLDPDLLVLDDVGKIWDTDLGDDTIAAVRDLAIPRCSSPRGVKDRQTMGIPDDAPYFNAGMMLIDLARWRTEKVSTRALDYLEQHRGRTDYSHQEALNAVLWNKWKQLDQRWNLIASLAGRRYSQSPQSAVAPGIVHFAGRFKPWRLDVRSPFAEPYAGLLREFAVDTTSLGSISDKLLGAYDRHLRDYVYGVERRLWVKRLI
ncbi:MAG: glycosyltransferase family 8 protein [Gemmatimonadaceae bacterium]